MPHHVLRFVRVIVRMDECLSDAYTIESGFNQSADNLHSVRVGIASDVNRRAICVRTRPWPALLVFMLNGTIRGIENKRNPRNLPRRV